MEIKTSKLIHDAYTPGRMLPYSADPSMPGANKNFNTTGSWLDLSDNSANLMQLASWTAPATGRVELKFHAKFNANPANVRILFRIYETNAAAEVAEDEKYPSSTNPYYFSDFSKYHPVVKGTSYLFTGQIYIVAACTVTFVPASSYLQMGPFKNP